MIGVIFGEKGAGKTKRILERANAAVKQAKGSVVFIDDDNSYMYDLDKNIRFINAAQYGIMTPKMIYGFICGIAAQDYDLEYLYIDGLLSFLNDHDLSTLEELFASMKALSDKRNINIIVSLSAAEKDLPSFIKDMVL